MQTPTFLAINPNPFHCDPETTNHQNERQNHTYQKNLKPADKALSRQQCAKLLAAAESELKGLVLIAVATAQRVGDILALKRVDVDMHKGILCFHLHKSGRRLEVPLDPRARMWFEQQPRSTIPVEPDSPLFPQLATRGAARTALYLRNLGQRIGVVVTAASFRHTFVRQLIEKGITADVIKHLLGERSEK